MPEPNGSQESRNRSPTQKRRAGMQMEVWRFRSAAKRASGRGHLRVRTTRNQSSEQGKQLWRRRRRRRRTCACMSWLAFMKRWCCRQLDTAARRVRSPVRVRAHHSPMLRRTAQPRSAA